MSFFDHTYRLLREKLAKNSHLRFTNVPRPNSHCLDLALAYFAAAKPGCTFVQVGACDGQTQSAAHRFVRTGAFRAVLIEPIPSNFERLSQSFKDVPNVQLVHAAVAFVSGRTDIYRVKEEGRWADSDFAKQWASFDREHPLRHGAEEWEIDAISIPAITLPDVMSRCGLATIDVLEIDTAGFDADIVEMALALPSPPKCLYFEYIHVKKRLPRLMQALEQAGYTWSYDLWSVLAIHSSLAKEWGQAPERRGSTATAPSNEVTLRPAPLPSSTLRTP